MKDLRYHISLYVIIPIIFAGYATLSSILTFQLAQYCIKQGINPFTPVIWLIVLVIIFGALCGLIIVWIILKPLKDFIRSAKTVLPDVDGDDIKSEGQLHKWDNVFKRVTNVLSMVDARQLFPNVIGESEVMRWVLSQVTKVAPTDSTVLIHGESGTGKELVATSIFEKSKRNKEHPFIKLNCVAIPEGLWESELFGHEKGAFTGATKQKIGKFELANNGTLFLDEIGDMPLNTQAKMLRVLQERELERVGGNKVIKVNVRIIAATNKDLKAMVAEKTFREDLYFRLNVFLLVLPPLRERRTDIPLLTEKFLKEAPREMAISPMAAQMLKDNYDWPGNVRELQNVVEASMVLCENDVIQPQDLPDYIIGEGVVMPMPPEEAVFEDEKNDAEEPSTITNSTLSLPKQLIEIEKAIIIDALKKKNGVQAHAAKLLGINDRQLWHKVKKLDIDPKKFKKEG